MTYSIELFILIISIDFCLPMFLLQGCNKKTQGWRSRRGASAQRALAGLARGQRPGASYVFCIWGRRSASSSASRAWRRLLPAEGICNWGRRSRDGIASKRVSV